MAGQMLRVVAAGENVAEDLSPVTPVISLTTSGSWTFICTSAFCIRWT